MEDQSVIKVNKLFYKLSSLTSRTSITVMNDILTKQAVKISLVDEGEAKKRTGKVRAGSIFNPFHRWGGTGGGDGESIWNCFNKVFN